MSGKRTGLLSRIAAPIAKVARRVARRRQEDEDDEIRRLLDEVLSGNATEPTRLTDDAFRMVTEHLAKQEEGAFQVKLHVISLVEFREAVGDKWLKVADKVMMIAEGVINLHLGAGNLFGRQGDDFFILIFRTCDNSEARRRAVTIAQELGTRLVGDQFLGNERPLALAAELSMEDGLNEDGSLNLGAVDQAVGQMRSIIASRTKDGAQAPRAWMRNSPRAEEDKSLRAHLKPSRPAPHRPRAADKPPIQCIPEPAPKAPPADPGWQKLNLGKEQTEKAPTWIILDAGPDKTAIPSNFDIVEDLGAEPMPADAKLSLIWRPTWVAAGEIIGAYEARIQRVDAEGRTPLEGTRAYPRDDEPAANALDRYRIANATRDFRTSEAAGNNSTVIVPIHWLTLTSENRMEFLAPFADVTRQSRGARVVIELFGVPPEVKSITLGAAIAQARELCREVFLRTRLSDPRAVAALDAGASAIGVDLAELVIAERTDDDHLLEALEAFQAQAAKSRLAAYVWGARRRKVIVGVVQKGFAMVNGPALMKDIPRPAKVLPAPKSRFMPS
ncbi:MAG TPA: hypothetical protein VL974_12735 [Magnetospirillum sp.]|jgi:hypothetical protein|nr:hypothetical protein [Magnetospirillum sp.]